MYASADNAVVPTASLSRSIGAATPTARGRESAPSSHVSPLIKISRRSISDAWRRRRRVSRHRRAPLTPLATSLLTKRRIRKSHLASSCSVGTRRSCPSASCRSRSTGDSGRAAAHMATATEETWHRSVTNGDMMPSVSLRGPGATEDARNKTRGATSRAHLARTRVLKPLKLVRSSDDPRGTPRRCPATRSSDDPPRNNPCSSLDNPQFQPDQKRMRPRVGSSPPSSVRRRCRRPSSRREYAVRAEGRAPRAAREARGQRRSRGQASRHVLLEDRVERRVRLRDPGRRRPRRCGRRGTTRGAPWRSDEIEHAQGRGAPTPRNLGCSQLGAADSGFARLGSGHEHSRRLSATKHW